MDDRIFTVSGWPAVSDWVKSKVACIWHSSVATLLLTQSETAGHPPSRLYAYLHLHVYAPFFNRPLFFLISSLLGLPSSQLSLQSESVGHRLSSSTSLQVTLLLGFPSSSTLLFLSFCFLYSLLLRLALYWYLSLLLSFFLRSSFIGLCSSWHPSDFIYFPLGFPPSWSLSFLAPLGLGLSSSLPRYFFVSLLFRICLLVLIFCMWSAALGTPARFRPSDSLAA